MATSSISFASFFFLALLPFPCFSSIAAAVRFSFSLNIFAIFCAAFFSRPVGRRDRAAEAAVRAVDDAGAEDDEDEVEEVETAPEPAEDDADDDDDVAVVAKVDGEAELTLGVAADVSLAVGASAEVEAAVELGLFDGGAVDTADDSVGADAEEAGTGADLASSSSFRGPGSFAGFPL